MNCQNVFSMLLDLKNHNKNKHINCVSSSCTQVHSVWKIFHSPVQFEDTWESKPCVIPLCILRLHSTAVLENDLIAQSSLPAIGSRPKTKKSSITQWIFMAKINKAEFFGQKKKLKLFTRNNIAVHDFYEKSCFHPVIAWFASYSSLKVPPFLLQAVTNATTLAAGSYGSWWLIPPSPDLCKALCGFAKQF